MKGLTDMQVAKTVQRLSMLDLHVRGLRGPRVAR